MSSYLICLPIQIYDASFDCCNKLCPKGSINDTDFAGALMSTTLKSLPSAVTIAGQGASMLIASRSVCAMQVLFNGYPVVHRQLLV